MGLDTVVILNKNNEVQQFVIERKRCGYKLLQYISFSVSDVEIPDSINGISIIEIGEKCFINHEELRNITFNNTPLQRIGVMAFASCTNLKEIIIPDSVSDIESFAFQNCTGLKRVVLPANLKCLRTRVFSLCNFSDDTEIVFNDGLEKIETNIFGHSDVKNHLTLRIPESVKHIATGAFDPETEIVTLLPYDNSWFLEFPCGESIIDKDNNTGIVKDIEFITRSACLVLDVLFDDSVKQVFYPFIIDSGYSFSEAKNQKKLLNYIENGLYSDYKDTYTDWNNGLVKTYKKDYSKYYKTLKIEYNQKNINAAYQWAKAEQEKYFSNAPRIRILNLNNFVIKHTMQLSLFPSEDNETALLRLYSRISERPYQDFPRDKNQYFIITNFAEVKNAYPEIADFVIRNGVFSYYANTKPFMAKQYFEFKW